MNRNRNITRLLAFFCICFFVVACSDNDSEELKYPLLQEEATDVTNGYNLIIMDLDKLEKIKLYTQRKISLEYHNDDTDFQVIQEDGKQCILPVLRKNISELKPFVVDLKIKIQSYADESDVVDKHIRVAFRHNKTAPSTVDVNYTRAIGKGTKPWGDMGNVTYPILDFNAIYDNLARNENLTLKSIFFETSGERYVSSLEKMGTNVGLSGSIPIKGVMLSGSFAFGYDKSTSSANYYEYYIGYYGKKMSEVKFNKDWAGDNLCALLDTTVNNVLNNPSTAAYKNYSNDSLGITKLLDQYGTHIITKASFGGNYITLYAREENAYETSVGYDMGVSISAKKPAVSTQKWIDVYKNKTGSTCGSASGSGSNYQENSDEASKSFYIITAKGGNASDDMDSWDESITMDSKNTWIPISYLTEGDTSDDTGLLRIDEIVVDSARKAAIKKYFDSYFVAHSVKTYDSPMVVADFMMVADDEDGEPAGKPKSFIAKDPCGIYRFYYPMMANGNAPVDHGYAIETSSSTYIKAFDEKNHYWYYALGHVDEEKGFYGIVDAQFRQDGKLDATTWTRRGNHTNDGITGDVRNNYVFLKYASKGTDITKLIKGIALYNFDDVDGIKSEGIIASSGGTEMPYPFGTNDEHFKDYWSSFTVNDDCNGWIHGLVHYHNFKIAYSCENLDVNFSFGDGNMKGKICHPKKWGE